MVPYWLVDLNLRPSDHHVGSCDLNLKNNTKNSWRINKHKRITTEAFVLHDFPTNPTSPLDRLFWSPFGTLERVSAGATEARRPSRRHTGRSVTFAKAVEFPRVRFQSAGIRPAATHSISQFRLAVEKK